MTELLDPSEPNDPNERNPTGRLLDESRELPNACVFIIFLLHSVELFSFLLFNYLEQSAFGSCVFSALSEITDRILTNGCYVF